MSETDTDRYPFGYGDEELERLGDQHRVWQEHNQGFLSRAGFEEGDTLVDLGCGPGFTTLDLARRVGPKGRVIAVDRDGERSIPRVRRLADRAGLENVETRVAELERFDLPPESIDGVYGRWVLMYLPEDEVRSLIVRIASWLKPGAACALAELCNYRHITVHPRAEHLDLVAEALMRAAGAHGGNPEIGNVLPGFLDHAGLCVELGVVVKAIRPATQEWIWPDALFRQLLPRLVDRGYLTPEVSSRFLAEWEVRCQDPATVFFPSPVMEAVGRRPRGE
jgi:SAM-dependent methyltransferase